MKIIRLVTAIFILLPVFCLTAGTLKVPSQYATISLAIIAAQSGDTIKIAAGTYTEHLLVSQNLTIIGAGKTQTLIKGLYPSTDSTVLKINYATVLVRDLQFNMTTNNDASRRGIVAVNSNVTVKQCVFVTPMNVGIAALNGTLTVDSVLISSINSGSNIPAVDSAAAGQGSGVACDNGIMIMNSHFTINHFTGGANIDHIIDIYPDTNGYVLRPTKYPVDPSQSVVGTIENSTFYAERNGAYGQAIRIYGRFTRPAAQLVICNNRFVGQAPDTLHAVYNDWTVAAIGFSGTGGFAEIYGNNIQHFNSGISFYGYATANIHNNVIINNARNGIITSWGGGIYAGLVDLGGGTYNSPGRNTIYNNGQYNVKNLNGFDVSALYNNWGTVNNAQILATMYDHNKFSSLGTVLYDLTGLPVELTSFTAAAVGNSIKLDWETATEINNYGFDIERSLAETSTAGASPNWTKIGFVQGHGNSNSLKHYTMTDINPGGSKIQYRLKQIDTDGKFEYSNTVDISPGALSNFSVQQNYPNPFNPETTIKYSLPVETGHAPSLQLVTLKIYDTLGREVATLVNEQQPAGNYSVKFNGQSIASGIYLYKLQSGNFIQTRKMILMK